MTHETILATVAIINGWNGHLTWDALCEAVGRETGALYKRQTLSNYLEITAAYHAYCSEKSSLPKESKESKSQRKIRQLEMKIIELEAVRDALLEKFARWVVNASTRNLDETFLDQPLRRLSRSENY
jgi:hypothetical protein